MKLIYGTADEFPDFSRISSPDLPCDDVGWPNMVFCAPTGQRESPPCSGPLSIKATFGGREVYETSDSRFVVDSSSYLVLNEGTSYHHLVDPDAGGKVESFGVFFQNGFPPHLWREQTASEEDLLDEPDGEIPGVPVVEILHRHDQIVTPFLTGLRRRVRRRERVDPFWLAEKFRYLFGALMTVNGTVIHELENISGVRLATRVERLRRLRVARDYMHDNFREELTLEVIASAAALSPYHFLRSFREAFGLTPHQYLTAQRLEHARLLLRETDLPVSSICYDVGFDSPSSFSTLFRRSVGISPMRYRAT